MTSVEQNLTILAVIENHGCCVGQMWSRSAAKLTCNRADFGVWGNRGITCRPSPPLERVGKGRGKSGEVREGVGTKGIRQRMDPQSVDTQLRIANCVFCSIKVTERLMPPAIHFLPMSHFYGFTLILRAFNDCSIVYLMARFSIQEYVRLIQKYQVQLLSSSFQCQLSLILFSSCFNSIKACVVRDSVRALA